MKVCAGWNMPGYLPDFVDEFDGMGDALEFLVEELGRVLDGLHERELGDTYEATETRHAIGSLNEVEATLTRDVWVTAGPYVYFAQEAEEVTS